MKKKRRAPDMGPKLSPSAEAAILRLARLLGRQMARELHEEALQREKSMLAPPSPSE